jgi:hypothetical protein
VPSHPLAVAFPFLGCCLLTPWLLPWPVTRTACQGAMYCRGNLSPWPAGSWPAAASFLLAHTDRCRCNFCMLVSICLCMCQQHYNTVMTHLFPPLLLAVASTRSTPGGGPPTSPAGGSSGCLCWACTAGMARIPCPLRCGCCPTVAGLALDGSTLGGSGVTVGW